MKYLLGIFFILMISQVYAVCEIGQIDINSASLTELDGLSGIGPVKAQAIIDSRYFDSVDNLIEVYGIGPATLEKIKTQGLACVEEEETYKVQEYLEDAKSAEPASEDKTESFVVSPGKSLIKKNVELELIKLNALDTKDIKSESESKNLDKNAYAKYGFVGFCVLLGFLFILKKRPVQEID